MLVRTRFGSIDQVYRIKSVCTTTQAFRRHTQVRKIHRNAKIEIDPCGERHRQTERDSEIHTQRQKLLLFKLCNQKVGLHPASVRSTSLQQFNYACGVREAHLYSSSSSVSDARHLVAMDAIKSPPPFVKSRFALISNATLII